LTKRCLHQLSKFNAKLNSAVATRHNEALEEAKRADDAISRGVAPSPDTIQGRLWGVPILVKECFEMKGMPFTGGVVARRSMIGSQDAPVIKALKEAGLIIIASTNTSEACSKCDSCFLTTLVMSIIIESCSLFVNSLFMHLIITNTSIILLFIYLFFFFKSVV
jgi:Asp-tRNA(Asn)/Glu-tRNA(Gln) amidotransferase A subunit family amidase